MHHTSRQLTLAVACGRQTELRGTWQGRWARSTSWLPLR